MSTKRKKRSKLRSNQVGTVTREQYATGVKAVRVSPTGKITGTSRHT